MNIFERRWEAVDGIELARLIVAGEVHPDSVSAMMGMGWSPAWFTALVRELARLGQRKQAMGAGND